MQILLKVEIEPKAPHDQMLSRPWAGILDSSRQDFQDQHSNPERA